MLPAPNLDDRRFQELVDEAKRRVQQRCPEWTDHNVSDPGVTLIELFAWMTDQLVYRLNRVPERNYIKFLELIGARMFPPTAARTEVTLWLSAPQPEPEPVRVASGTEVATVRTETAEAVVFTTVEELAIVPCHLAGLASTVKGREVRQHFDALEAGRSFYCFDRSPKVGDVLMVGLSEAVPSCAVALRFDCAIEGVGVDPTRPPLRWEAWTGDGWGECEVDRDGTGGLNRAGDVILHVHRDHAVSLIGRQRAGWLRCQVVEAHEHQPVYSASPEIKSLSAFTVGGTIPAVNARVLNEEALGLAEGVPGQRFTVQHQPVVPADDPTVVQVAEPDGWVDWRRVETFAHSGPDDRHFLLDEAAGEVAFGPAVRDLDGSLRQYGATPPKGAPIRLHSYRAGGGRRGNVARGALSILKSSIPYVARIENRKPASGGVDGEDIESLKLRGPILLRTRSRAVTAEDYEQLAREAAPEVARVRCAPAGNGADAGGVRILVVPSAADDETGQMRFEDLVPADETLARIAEYLDERRVIGARVMVEPPVYQGVTVVARLLARPEASGKRLQTDAVTALYRYFHAIRGGPGSNGWPFGRPVQVGEVYSVLQRVRGVEMVNDARLYAADPITGQRGDATQRLEVGPHALVFSYQHQVRVDMP